MVTIMSTHLAAFVLSGAMSLLCLGDMAAINKRFTFVLVNSSFFVVWTFVRVKTENYRTIISTTMLTFGRALSTCLHFFVYKFLEFETLRSKRRCCNISLYLGCRFILSTL